MSEPSAIRRAIENGVAYLESAQLPSGEIPIEISPTPEMSVDCVREPVVFPAALAARALSITPSAARVRSRALDFLLREMEPDGLWRHPSSEKPGHYYTPLDVDDTSIASTALAAAGRRFPNNRALLLANREMMSTIWYGSRFTVWYFFSQALHEIAPEAGEMIVPRIEAMAPVNSLELAVATSTLLLWNRVPDVGPLIEAQLPSGAWPRVGFYHMGQRRLDSQPKPPWWGSEALTTVFAVEALTRYFNRTYVTHE